MPKEPVALELIFFWSTEFVIYFSKACFIFKLSVFIFFIYNFIKKYSKICNIYFYLIFIGLFWDICFCFTGIITQICGIFDNKCLVTIAIYSITKWYNSHFCAIWTLALSFNRLTAIVWWQKHDNSWQKYFWKILVFLLLYPFFANIDKFITYFHLLHQCNTFNDCKELNKFKIFIVTGIANGIVASISFIIAIITAVIYRKKVINKDVKFQQNSDRKLVIQAIISSITFFIYFSLFLISRKVQDDISAGKDDAMWKIVVFYFSRDIAFEIYLLTNYVLLFAFSKILRAKFLKFYRISQFYNFITGKKTTPQIHRVESFPMSISANKSLQTIS